jgi:acetyl esterase/lipase
MGGTFVSIVCRIATRLAPSADGLRIMSLSSLRSLSAPAWRDELVGLPGRPELGVRLYGCDGRCDGKPLVLHFHAGAFVGGSLDSGAAVAGLFAAAGAVVASVDYPLAPAHPFPQAAESGYAVLAWAERQRRRLAAARAPIFVAGEEAGGNLAAAVAMMARDRGGPELTGAILLSPMLDVCVATASQRKAHAGPVGCPWADGWRAYLAREDDAVHPYAAPGSSLRLAGLPPTLLLTAADDPLRDETRSFAQRLRAAGVPVELNVFDVPTGWPRSYHDQPAAAPWTAALHAPVQAFLHSTIQPTTTSGSAT